MKIHSISVSFYIVSAICQAQVTITPYPVNGPIGIVTGPDNNLWYTEGFISGANIGRLTTSGAITLFPIPSGNAEGGIAVGPDGNLWFTEYRTNKVGKITPSGFITEFTIPTGGSYPYGITSGPDGNVWFAVGYGATNIGRITPSGLITEFAIPSGYNASRITKGPDGNLWFTENFGNKIGRITPSGTITEFPIPTPGSYPFGITTGADGNIWFAEELGNKIGRITPSGAISEFPIVGPGTGPVDITSGPDGNLWFTEQGQYFGRITTSGVITSFPIAAIGSGLLTTGPDGNLWITDYYGNKVFKAVICSAPTVTANASPSILWPPNHKMVSVSINAATSGGCDSSLCKIVSVSSNEPIDADGDWVITGDLSLQLRAERLGQGTGRIYTITIRCTDGSGNQTTKGVTVTAPHDQGK